MSFLVEWPDTPPVPLPVHLPPRLPLCRCPCVSRAPHIPGLLGPAEASSLAQGWGWIEDLDFTSDQGRGSPEGPSSGPSLPPLPRPVWVTLSLLAGASEPGMDGESPWHRWQPGGRAEAGKTVEVVGSRLVTHPHPQGPQPLAGWPGLPLPLPTPRALTPCLSPPVATVNHLACRGLDKLEEKLPFLQQPSETVGGDPGRGGGGREQRSLPRTGLDTWAGQTGGLSRVWAQLKKHQPDENNLHPSLAGWGPSSPQQPRAGELFFASIL